MTITFIFHRTGFWFGECARTTDVKNLVIRNNIFSQNTLFQIAEEGGLSAANLTVDHNLVNDYTGEYQYEIRGIDYVEGNPKFVNPSKANFHLQESSPAIDKGSSINAPTSDFDGNQRPQGAGYDLGAFEYVTVTSLYVEPSGLCGGNTPCYSAIQAAIDAAETESVIRIQQGTYDEDIITDHTYSLTLSGGWDSTFTTQSSSTVINSLTIAGTSGTVEIKNIVLQ